MLREEEADTPCKKVYFLVQCMYLARNPKEYHPKYFEMVREIQEAAPSTTAIFLSINEKIIEGLYYKAMKDAKDLITYEEELMNNARQA